MHTVYFVPAPMMTFRGFFIIARTVASDDMVGSFSPPPPEDTQYRLSSCTPSNVGVTHVNSERVDFDNTIHFEWTAPPAGTGAITFVYTTVQVRDVYWVAEMTDMIQGICQVLSNVLHINEA